MKMLCSCVTADGLSRTATKTIATMNTQSDVRKLDDDRP